MANALFPGTFDPFTNGHLDIVRRAVALFGGVTVLVAENRAKAPLLAAAVRVRVIRAALAGLPRATVDRAAGLVADYAREHGFAVIVRGVRHAGDFAAECQMAQMNRDLAPGVDTVFLPAAPAQAHVASSLVREIVLSGGDPSPFVPPSVAAAVAATRTAGSCSGGTSPRRGTKRAR